MSAPDPRLLRYTHLRVKVIHVPARDDRKTLGELFAEISDRYDLRMVFIASDHAVLSGPDNTAVTVKRDDTTVETDLPWGFVHGLDRVVGMLDDALSGRIENALVFGLQELELRASWDCGHRDAANRFLRRDVLGLSKERIASIEDADFFPESFGLNVRGSLGDGTARVTIEPDHDDGSAILISLRYRQDEPVYGTTSLAEIAQEIDAFIRGSVVDFVCASSRSE